MTCSELVELIGDYLDEEAARELCAEVETHLKECGPCKVEIDTIKKTILIYRKEEPCGPLSDHAKKKLFAALSYEYQAARSKPAQE